MGSRELGLRGLGFRVLAQGFGFLFGFNAFNASRLPLSSILSLNESPNSHPKLHTLTSPDAGPDP